MSEKYPWYDKCSKCGGEFERTSGTTFDTYPTSIPVKCKECGNVERSTPRSQADDMGWPQPEWEKKDEKK